MSAQFTIAGTGPVACKTAKKIVNFNLSHLVRFFIIFLLNFHVYLDAFFFFLKHLKHTDANNKLLLLYYFFFLDKRSLGLLPKVN